MAVTLKPEDHLADIELIAASGTVTAQSLCIPLASLPGLTAAEANPTTGDIREIVRTFLEAIYQSIATTPTADRPTKMLIEKLETQQAGELNKQIHTFTVRFLTTVPQESLAMQAE